MVVIGTSSNTRLNDNGKIGVVDRYVTTNRIKDINPKLEEEQNLHLRTHMVHLYFLYIDNRSLFKDFSLSVKLSLCFDFMFHSNKISER